MNPFEQFLEDAKRVRLTPEEKQSIKSAVSQHMVPHLFLSFFSMSIFKPVSWGIALLAVAFIAVGSYAYASPQVTKGDALYSWKTSFERMKVRGADTRLEKVEVYSALALRRLAEAKVLARELGASDLPTTVSFLHIPVAYAQTTTDGTSINGVEAQFDETGTAYFLISTTGEVTAMTEAAIEEAEEITDPAELQDALEVIDETQNETLTGLEEVAGEVGTEASEELLDAVAVALDETAQDAAEVDAALDDVAEALESGDTEVSVDVETSADLAAADDTDGEEATDENTVKLEAAQQTIATFKANLLESGVSEEDAQKLFDRVDAKLLKAQEALEDGNVNKMKGLLKATNALTNNAKHFAKKAQQEDDGDEADEGGEEEESASGEDDTGDEAEDESAADDSADADESSDGEDADATEEEGTENEGADAGEETGDASETTDTSVEASASASVKVKDNANKPESSGKSSGKGKKN